MKKSTLTLSLFVYCLGLCISAQALTVATSILPTETKTLLTVPKNRSAVVRSVIVTNPGTSSACGQQILRGASIKSDLCVPAGSSFQAHFSPALVFKAGDKIDLLNGDSVTTTTVTVNYRVIPPGKGLLDKEQ